MSSEERETVEEGPLFEAKTEAKLVELVMKYIRKTRPPIDQLVVVVHWKDGANKAQVGTRTSLLSELRARAAEKEVEQELRRSDMAGRMPVYEIDEATQRWAISWLASLTPTGAR